ncbi:MAG: D-alanyl-D-alanine carboxypeptidase [Clostridium sp.]|nr:D-alanyl-D-alanine carboxypeptidase [Clostridium sp.]
MLKRITVQLQCLGITFLLMFSLWVGVSFAVGEQPQFDALSVILIESQRGQVLYEKNPGERLHISSANKIMTGLIALEKMGNQLDSKVTISKNAVLVDGANLNLEVGGKYPLGDLVYSVLLDSANDSANALAEYIGGDEETFVEIMNKRAKELQMNDTHFTNPTGLYDQSQYTTANDIAILVRHAILKSTEFDRIFSAKAYPWTDKNGSRILINSNELFWVYDGIDGGRVGYNDPERQTVITTATRNGQRLISIVLDSPESSMYNDSIKLLDYGFENFRTGILVSNGELLKKIRIGEDSLALVALADYYYTYPVGRDYISEFDIIVGEDLKPPIGKDEVLGVAKYTLDDGTVIEVNLYTDSEIYSTMSWFSTAVEKLNEFREIVILLLILIFIELLLFSIYIAKFIKKKFFKSLGNFKKQDGSN